ncbi:hypothetical protein EI533_20740 [Pseudomonas donghuensis]|nr:hypothetical protein [Pseudomonas donghuensis]
MSAPTEAQIAACFGGGKQMICTLLLTALGDTKSSFSAPSNGWSTGSFRSGRSLFVPIPERMDWTPEVWPTSIAELNTLVGQLAGDPGKLESWLASCESEKLLLVVLIQSNECYGYLLGAPPISGNTERRVIPIFFDRVGMCRAFAREQQLEILRRRGDLRVLVLGCGLLGSMVIEQLATAGVGNIDALDKQEGRAHAMASRLQRLAPAVHVNAHREAAEDWVALQCGAGLYDAVIDLTGDVSVRSALVQHRTLSLAGTPILHGWMEPFCAATHLFYLEAGSDYPVAEPLQGVNVARWPSQWSDNLRAGGLEFPLNGLAEVAQAAGFIAERSVAVIDATVRGSLVWSWVRSEGFFNSLGVDVVCGPFVPKTSSRFDAVHITRSFQEIYVCNLVS